jgi:type IV secretion system protein VirB4
VFRREQLLSDWVPVEDHIAEDVVLLSCGSVAAFFEANGVSVETADSAYINYLCQQFNNMIRNTPAGQMILSIYLCRGLADPASHPPSAHKSAFAEALDIAYRERLYDHALYTNRIFIGVQIRPSHFGGDWFGERIAGKRAAKDTLEDRVRRLNDACSLLQAELSEYGLRRLGVVRRGRAAYSEIAETIAYAMTGVPRQVPLTTGRLGNSIFSEEIRYGHEAIEIRGPGYTAYAAMLRMHEFPAETWPGMLDGFLSAPYRLTLHQSIRTLIRSEGEAVITRKQNKMGWAGDKALSQAGALTTAADRHASGEFVMCDYNLSFCVFSDAGSGLGGVITEASKDLAKCSSVSARETKALMAAHLSMIPGNHRLRAKPGAISSLNFAALATRHNYPSGPKRSRWGNQIATLRTTGGTAYAFHWHDGESASAVANTVVTGETGSGKTLASGFLISQTAGRAKIFALDHKRGWEILIRAMGGDYALLGEGRPNFAPLKALANTPSDREFIADLLRGCIRQSGDYAMTQEEDRKLVMAVNAVMGLPPAERWIDEICAFLGNEAEGARARLQKWAHGNELGWVLDASEDAISLSGDLHGLDMTALLANARARGPAMLYLAYRITLQLDGSPTLILIDEGWQALLDDAFRSYIDKTLRTVRSKNGALVFLTQSPTDLVDSGIAASLIEQCPNQIHFPNPRATKEAYVDGLKRTRGEFEALRELRKGSGRFLLCRGAESLIAELRLPDMEDEIAVLSASEENLRLLDTLPESVKCDPVRMLAEFHALRKQRKKEMA